MALDDTSVLQIGTGHFYRGEVGAAAPTALGTIDSEVWTEIGHTSLEDILAFASEGGDATTLGTLQKKVLKTAYSARVETFTFNLQQWDEESQKLYFGSNMAEISTGSIWNGVPITPVPTQSAFLAVFDDGVKGFGIYAPKSELYRADDLSLEDTESLSSLPIQVKPLIDSTNTWPYAVTGLIAL